MIGRRHKLSVWIVVIAAAVVALGWPVVGKAQTITEFPLPSGNGGPGAITAGPDGALWFSFFSSGKPKIGRMTTAGTFSEFPLSANSNAIMAIAAGPDGALWFIQNISGKIGRITVGGVLTEFPTSSGTIGGITAGPDGALWFTDAFSGRIGRITTAGSITYFDIPPAGSTSNSIQPYGITAGPDGALWFVELDSRANKIGRITTAGNITEFLIPTPDSVPFAIAQGSDGALWFTEEQVNKIGRITTTGTITEFSIPASNRDLRAIAAGPDGALWFIEPGNGANKIGRITTAGAITEFTIPTANSGPAGIVAGPDGALWFTEQQGNKIGRLFPPTGTGPMFSAVLPSSRSVQVGTAANALTTIINAGNNIGIECGLSLGSAIPATFAYQTTNPVTNQLTGTVNTPVNIAAGGSQSYVFAITPSAPFIASDVSIKAGCANSSPAATIIGVNTLLLSASTSPVPDIVALAATASNDGIVNIPGATGTGAFAVASVNVGATATITVSADTRLVTLPITLALCQTDPNTAACLAPPSPTVTSTIATNATPTFSIFVTATGNVPFDPANNRIFLRFKDFNGDTRGATSVAVRTQ